MNDVTKSALIRAVRTVLQIAASFVTVELVEEVGQQLGGRFNLDQAATALVVAILTAVYSFLHRKFLDPSRLPSLVDPVPPAVAGIPPDKAQDF